MSGPSVRPCVRIIIDFTEWHMRVGHMPLNSETLKTRFQINCSKKVKVVLVLEIHLILDQFLADFLRTFEKQVPGVACVT